MFGFSTGRSNSLYHNRRIFSHRLTSFEPRDYRVVFIVQKRLCELCSSKRPRIVLLELGGKAKNTGALYSGELALLVTNGDDRHYISSYPSTGDRYEGVSLERSCPPDSWQLFGIKREAWGCDTE